ncbi:MAG: radical SAM protein [Oligoflexia bacterium]|nr:radical SAM protein [Oligoflexia bacterium]
MKDHFHSHNKNDDYKIDAHKLIYHPERVSEWLKSIGDWEKEKNIFPIYMEISPVSYCNHRCKFCALDFVNNSTTSSSSTISKLDTKILANRIKEFADLGIKSIMFAGEGEPTLHPDLPQLLDLCSEYKIDTSLTTNFIIKDKTKIANFVKNCKWIKISVGGGNEETYSKIHGTKAKANDFEILMENIKYALSIRKDFRNDCAIGMQIILLPDNFDSVLELAEKAANLGVDYLVVKPYSQHPLSITSEYANIDYKEERYLSLESELKKISTDKFKIIYRSQAINHYIQNERSEQNEQSEGQDRYKTCYSVPFFWSYITAIGDVLGCSNWFNNEHFNYGNINNNSFAQIWRGEKRKESINYIKEKLKVSDCRLNCRMENVNYYLWELINPHPHVNFI